MKIIFTAISLLLGSQAFAQSSVILNCDDRPNMIFDGVRSITFVGTDVTLVEEAKSGALIGHRGTLLKQTASKDVSIHFSEGVEVTVPAGLLSGEVKSAAVQMSTYDYPYETTQCTLVK